MESWIRTYTGLRFDPFAPDPKAIKIEDIAHALANQCRFSGHTSKFYSVAEHSVRVAWDVMQRITKSPGYKDWNVREWGLKALLHDASEAYVVDIPSPVKRQKELSLYRDLEEGVMQSVSVAFNQSGWGDGSWWKSPVIKTSDARVCAAEARDLMKGWEEFPSREDWEASGGPIDETIRPWSPKRAEKEFLALYKALT